MLALRMNLERRQYNVCVHPLDLEVRLSLKSQMIESGTVQTLSYKGQEHSLSNLSSFMAARLYLLADLISLIAT